MLGTGLSYAVPEYHESCISGLVEKNCGNADAFMLARTDFAINDLKVEGYVLLFFRIESFQTLLQSIDREITA